MRSKIFWILLSLWIVLAAIALVIRGLGPGYAKILRDEYKVMLGYCRSLQALQEEARESRGKYANLDELLGQGNGRYRIVSECQDGFCFSVQGDHEKYSITIFPDPNEGHRTLSLYTDETGVRRERSHKGPADATGHPVPPERLRSIEED